MEIKIEIDELRKRKLFVATPMYGGVCSGMFAKSTADLSAFCAQHGIPLQLYYLFNESLITRARNYCMDEFFRSEAEHLMFIDSDIGFDPRDVIALMALQAQDEKYDIIGGPYPKKTISWEKVKRAVDKGIADQDPNVLDRYIGDYVFNPKSGQHSIAIDQPVEVLEIGTGFMMISKRSIKKFNESYPQYMYKPDHVRTEHFDGSREIMQYFQAEIDPKSKRYLSEDYWYCFGSQTKIETPKGQRTIKDLVDSKYSGYVLSLDIITGEKVWKKVTNWWSRPNGKRGLSDTKKKWVSFNTDCDNNTKSKLKVTEDHRIAIFDDIFNPEVYYTEAKNTNNKFIVRKPQRSENSLYSKDQISMLIGTLLGDSSIGKQGLFTCQHSDTQKEYIELKANLFNGKITGPFKQNGFGEGKFKYVMHTPINAQTRKLRNMVYKNKKTVSNIIDMVDEKSLAFWYMDDGCLNKNQYATIETNGFSETDNILLKNYLKDKFDLDIIVEDKKVKYKGEIKTYKTIRMNKESSGKFFDLIYKYIPECMRYKLPTVYHNKNDWFNYDNIKSLDYAASFVKEVKYLPKYSSRLYDIEVEGVHNFFASGTLAHNCQKSQEIGLRTWLCPWMKLQHVGTYIFGGSLADLAAVGASATADPEALGKKKK